MECDRSERIPLDYEPQSTVIMEIRSRVTIENKIIFVMIIIK